MSGSLHTENYAVFRRLLVEARKSVGITQSELAERLGKPQSFVSKFESGERRLDFPEWVDVIAVLGLDPAAFVATYGAQTGTRHRRHKPRED